VSRIVVLAAAVVLSVGSVAAAQAAQDTRDTKSAAVVLQDGQLDRVTAGDSVALAFGQYTSTFTSFTQLPNGLFLSQASSRSSASY